MGFSRADLLRIALEKIPSTSPLKSNFIEAVRIAYLEENDVELENLSPQTLPKLEKDLLHPFCNRIKGFYKDKKIQSKIDRMIAQHRTYFDTTVPDISSFVVDPPAPVPRLAAPMDIDSEGDVKAPLEKTQL